MKAKLQSPDCILYYSYAFKVFTCYSSFCSDWGQGEDVFWGQQIPARADISFEENPFISVQFSKPKSIDCIWAPDFVSWLLSSGNGVFVQPKRLAAQFWCNGTDSCGM
jgi:hypothetical protein